MKRPFDFIVSFIGIIIFMPVFLIISLLVILNDGSPILFRQKRIGKDRNPFVLYKFRSMHVMNSAEKGIFEPGFNSRITSIGKFLRKTKLDELPQLFNVLKGDMSLVGPRPEVEKWVALYPDQWKRVLTVRPGITDNASLVFRDEESLLAKSEEPEIMYRDTILPQKLHLYEEYVINRTFFGDVMLILKTIGTIISK